MIRSINKDLWQDGSVATPVVHHAEPLPPMPEPVPARSHRHIRAGLIASLTFALAIVGFAVDYLFQPNRFPLVNIEVNGVNNAHPNHIQDAIASVVSRNIFRIDLVAVAEAAQSVPWVADATVRRRWPPGTLEIDVHERVISTRWNENMWLDDAGNPVAIPGYENPDVPILSGPADAGKEMLQKINDWRPLLQQSGWRIMTLSRSNQGGWQVGLAHEAERDAADASGDAAPFDSMKVFLGSRDPEANLVRFLRLYRSLEPHAGLIASADMRYPDGVAIRWNGRPKTDMPSVDMTQFK